MRTGALGSKNAAPTLPSAHLFFLPRAIVGRYGGAYIPAEAEDVDPKPVLDKKCGEGCTDVWATYEKCAERIEAKVRRSPTRRWPLWTHDFFWLPVLMSRDVRLSQGRGECSGYYMDYFRCIDKCSTKTLFKELA